MRSDRVQSLAGFFRLQDRSYHATGYKAQKVRVTGYQQQRQSGAHGAAIPSFRKPSYPSYRSQDAVQRQNVPTNPAAVTGGQFRLLSNTGPFGIGPVCRQTLFRTAEAPLFCSGWVFSELSW